jgi:hypothetical protein
MRDGGDFTAAVRACGFTLRQARFLGLVLEHSGVCAATIRSADRQE